MQMRKKDVLNLARFLSFTQKRGVKLQRKKKGFGVNLMPGYVAKKKATKLFGDFLRTVNNATMFKNITQCLQIKFIILWIKSLP